MHVTRSPAITITTDASGDGTGTSVDLTGRIIDIQYVKNNYDNGMDFTVVGATTGRTYLAGTDVNASASFAPRQPTHSTAGAAALYAAGGTAVNDHICVANEKLTITVAQGGNAKSGTFYVTVA